MSLIPSGTLLTAGGYSKKIHSNLNSTGKISTTSKSEVFKFKQEDNIVHSTGNLD